MAKGDCLMIEIYQMEMAEEKQEDNEWEKWLELKFSQVFQDPEWLPSIKEVDYVINLKENNQIVNIQLFRYPYFQKSKIEKKVKEVLEVGII